MAVLRDMWDLSSLTRVWTRTPSIGNTVLTIGPPGESLLEFLATTTTVKIQKVPLCSLNSLSFPLVVKSSPPLETPDNHCFSSPESLFAFSRMSYKWDPTVGYSRLFFHLTQCIWDSSKLFQVWIAGCFLVLSLYIVYIVWLYTTVCLSIPQLRTLGI